ncbi:MAG: hypothetical protein R3E89_06330 [Thiolinea sp.]
MRDRGRTAISSSAPPRGGQAGTVGQAGAGEPTPTSPLLEGGVRQQEVPQTDHPQQPGSPVLAGWFDRSGWLWPVAVVAMLLVLLVGLFRHGGKKTDGQNGDQLVTRGQPALSILQQACQQNDANAALNALHAWIRQDLTPVSAHHQHLACPGGSALRAGAG